MDYSIKEDIIENIFEKIKCFILPSEKNNYKSRFLQSNVLLCCVVLLLVLEIGTTLISINIPYNIFFADITKSALKNFVNQTRQSIGLQPLLENEKLNQAAQLKAENMVQNNYFNHTSPTGVTPWFWFLRAGYKYKYAGENLAIGFFDSQEVYNAWLNSPSHKANIVNPNYTEVGTAVVGGFGQSNNAIVVVQEFGSQLPAEATAVKNTNTKSTPAPTPAPTPVATTNTQPPTPNTNEKVLSQSTESQSLLESPKGNTASNFFSKLINFVFYNYKRLLQDIIYGVSSVIIGVLLALIFFNFKIRFKKELVFRAVLIVVLLSAATMLSRETIISFIPHQIVI